MCVMGECERGREGVCDRVFCLYTSELIDNG